MSNPHPALHTGPDNEPGELAAVGALLLVAALIAGIFWGMRNPAGEERQTLLKANALLADGYYLEASFDLERALPIYNSAQMRLDLSYAYLARRDPERAERQALIALAALPLDLKPAAWSQLGRIFAFAGRPDDARNAWDNSAAAALPFRGVAPIEAEVRSAIWHQAMLDWARYDYISARRKLESLITQDDIYAVSARVKLAQLLAPDNSDISRQHIGRAEGAIHAGGLTGAAILDLSLPGLREGLSPEAITTTIAGLNRAFVDADTVRRGRATQGELAALWGRAFLQQDEPYLARTQLEKSVASEPGLADAHSYLALAYLNTGDEQRALSQLKSAVDIAPSRPLPHHVLSTLYVRAQDWNNAAKELSTLKKLEPDSVQLLVQLGEYYAVRGAYDAAEDAYISAVDKQRGTALSPGGLDAALTLSRFYTDVRGSGCENGLPAARESLQNNPGDPASLDAVGWSLVQCAKPVEALSTLEHAVSAASHVPRYRYHLGRAYALLSRVSDARAQFSRVLDLDPAGPWERDSLSAIAALPK